MFEPMTTGDPLFRDILGLLAIGLALAGFYWIYRITRDIEDN